MPPRPNKLNDLTSALPVSPLLRTDAQRVTDRGECRYRQYVAGLSGRRHGGASGRDSNRHFPPSVSLYYLLPRGGWFDLHPSIRVAPCVDFICTYLPLSFVFSWPLWRGERKDGFVALQRSVRPMRLHCRLQSAGYVLSVQWDTYASFEPDRPSEDKQTDVWRARVSVSVSASVKFRLHQHLRKTRWFYCRWCPSGLLCREQ